MLSANISGIRQTIRLLKQVRVCISHRHRDGNAPEMRRQLKHAKSTAKITLISSCRPAKPTVISSVSPL